MNTSLPGITVDWVCQDPTLISSAGIFLHDNPMKSSVPALLAQLSVTALVNLVLQYILTPFGLSSFVSMVLVGFAMGPTFWGEHHPIIEALYTKKSFYVVHTFAFFGCVLFMFIIGIKMDMSMVKRAGKKAIAVGCLVFFLPLVLSLLLAVILTRDMESSMKGPLYILGTFQSVSTFHVISCLLADLKLLDSEVGKLASSASMISGTFSYVMVIGTVTLRISTYSSRIVILWMFLCAVFAVVLIFYVFRPIMFLMIRNTPEGKPVEETYVFFIFIMLMVLAMFGEVMGQHAFLAAVGMGVAVPDGPPLGSALVQKLESFSTWILLPSYFVYSAATVNLFSIHASTVILVSYFTLVNFIGKFLGGMLPALYCKMPPIEAVSVGLIMSAQGISDILLLQLAQILHLIDDQMYSAMVIAMVILTSIITPTVKVIYDPTKKYARAGNRTIQHANPNSEFRILSCIYNQDNTPSIISLIELSNPTARSPLCCYVIHLMELAGRLSPLLIYHKQGRRQSSHSNYSSHIIKAFRSYERQNDHVIINLFTAISPFVSMHDQVCRLALDKVTYMLIIPFHKQWRADGMEECLELRAVNNHIIGLAPCSVGILVDRGNLADSDPTKGSLQRIGVIFVHGKDDREALAYAMRMCERQDVSVTVIRVIETGEERRNSLEVELDNDIIFHFRNSNVGKKHHVFREEVVKDGVDLISVVRTLENSFDLILVGRTHDSKSILFMGMTEWNEFPELGLIGDMLASSDSECRVSVLVVQQKGFAYEGGVSHINYLINDPSEAVEVLYGANKEWPPALKEHKHAK